MKTKPFAGVKIFVGDERKTLFQESGRSYRYISKHVAFVGAWEGNGEYMVIFVEFYIFLHLRLLGYMLPYCNARESVASK